MVVIDRHWNVILANRACSVLFGPTVVGSNFVRDSLANPAAAQAIANWPEIAWAGLDRLRHHLDRTPFDEELHHLVSLAESALAGVTRPATAKPTLTVCPGFRMDGQIIRTIAMVARFDPIAEG